MNFELSRQQKALQKKARNFMEREIIPVADDLDRKYHPFSREIATELIKKLKPLGYLGALVPKEDGGDELGHLAYGLLIEELARAYASLAMLTMMGQTFAAWSLWKRGTPQQKAKYLGPLLSGDMIGCFAATEPAAGSDVRAIESVAVRGGNKFTLNGKKTWIPAGSIADLLTVVASVDKEKGADAFAWILVDKKVSPFRTREMPRMGLRSCPMGEIEFNDCSVPVDNVVVAGGKGYNATIGDTLFLHPGVAAIAVGLSQAATDAAVKYAQERKQFDRPIGHFQLIQEMIADMVIETQAARFLMYDACQLIDRGVICIKEASMAKAFATEAAWRITAKGIEAHGAYGISEAYPLQRYLRDTQVLIASVATTQIQKLLVGREALGLNAFAQDIQNIRG